jgi:alpha-mannosidase
MKSKSLRQLVKNGFPLLVFVLSLTNINGQNPETTPILKTDIKDQGIMYMMTYDHGGLVLWGTDHFKKYLQSAKDWLDKYPSFKIGLDNEAYTYDFLKQNDTALLGEIISDLKKYKGRFGIGTCTYGQPLSQFINEESNIRQIGYALETDQSVFQYTPSVYLMSEHAMHSQIPQILKGFGFKGAIMRTHFMMYGYNPTFNSPIGWWSGVDGSTIPTIPTYKGEGSGFGWVTEDNLILTRYPGPECSEPPSAFREKFSNINPLLATRADDSGLRQEGLVKEYEGKPGYKWLLLDEIFPNYPDPVDEYKTQPDDFHVRMPWGYCGNEIWNMSRQAEVKILTAERIAAMESLLGGKNHENQIHRSWKNLLVAQHHDIQICGILDDSRRFLPASIVLSDSVIYSSMNFIASKMQGGNLAQITVFNPLSWQRKEWIGVTFSLPENIKEITLLKGDKEVPFEILSSEHLKLQKRILMNLMVYVDIPALTFQSFSVIKANKSEPIPKGIEVDRDNLRITSQFWVISLDKKGGISAIKNRITGKEMFMARRNAYFAGVINGQAVESSGKWDLDTIDIKNNQLVIHEEGSVGSIPYRFEMKLYSSSPVINLSVKFHFNDEKIGRVSENKKEIASAFLHEEKLRFKIFPDLGIGTTGIRDLPFTIAETEDKYIEGNYWTAVADGHKGLAFFNRGNMGSVYESDKSFSLPLAYSMYYVWKTVMLKGEFKYDFAIYPFEGKWNEAGLHQKAIEYNFPCIAAASVKGNGKSGNQIKLFDISSPDIVLSAMYTLSGKPYIRFYESSGKKGELAFKYLNNTSGVLETDLRGITLTKTIPILNFSPWQIRTFCLQPSNQN